MNPPTAGPIATPRLGQAAGQAHGHIDGAAGKQAEHHHPFAAEAIGHGPSHERRDQPGCRLQRDQQPHRRQWHVQPLPDIDSQKRPDHAATCGADQHPRKQQPELAWVFSD
jgi:hypothetical protein